DHSIAACELRGQGKFQLAKVRLAVPFEQLRDGETGSAFDFLVEIQEVAAGAPRDATTDRCLARSRQADEDEVGRRRGRRLGQVPGSAGIDMFAASVLR